MKIISKEPNPSGAYPPIQEVNLSAVPEDNDIWPDTLETETFYAYKGFITPTVKDGVVECYEPNTLLYEQWESEHPETDEAPEETTVPTVWDELDAAYQEGVDSV